MKRIIEVEEIMIGNEKYYKAKGCKTLIFDEKGFEQITKPLPKVEKVKEQLLNCKFVVLETGSMDIVPGKIYTVIDGKFKIKSLGKFPLTKTLHSFEELEAYFKSNGGFSREETKIMRVEED